VLASSGWEDRITLSSLWASLSLSVSFSVTWVIGGSESSSLDEVVRSITEGLGSGLGSRAGLRAIMPCCYCRSMTFIAYYCIDCHWQASSCSWYTIHSWQSSRGWVLKWGYTSFSSFDIMMVVMVAIVTVTGNEYIIWIYDLLKCVYDYIWVCLCKGKALVTWVAEKSVKRALNLWDLLRLTIFIYIIYLHTILVRFRLSELKSIYLLQEHYIKLVAERSYHLPCGQAF